MKHEAIRPAPSLLERAAEVYDFGAALRAKAPAFPAPELQRDDDPQPAPPALEGPGFRRDTKKTWDEDSVEVDSHPARPDESRKAPPVPPPVSRYQTVAPIDRVRLAEAGFIIPDAAATPLAEEYRIIKRQLLNRMAGETIAADKRRVLLVCSANPDEGKTFSAINLALSLASERGAEVLLIDGDVNKPEIPALLGLEAGPGLIDAIADPAIDPESLVVPTDIGGLSLMPAGRQAHDVTELLASAQAETVLRRLADARPGRILLFDSPPVLMASAASVLASRVGQALLVVRADKTKEADLREAVALLGGCADIAMMLNAAAFSAGGPRFGTYYGVGE